MGIQVYYILNTEGNESENRGRWKLGAKAFPGSVETWAAFMYHIERKYLPSLLDPCPLENATPSYHSRMLMSPLFTDKEDNFYLEEIWNLQISPRLTKEERLTMLTMMDKARFKVEDSSEVFEAWRKVASNICPDTERAFNLLIGRCQNIIDKIDNVSCLAINWNSVSNFYSEFGYDDEDFFDCVEVSHCIGNEVELSKSCHRS